MIEPYWYGDEGIYAVIGQSLRDGNLLYRDIWDNKPPVLYLIYALVNGDLFWAKMLSLIAGTATVVVFFLLAKKIFKKMSAVITPTVLFVILFGLPILEGNIANAENFMLLPIVLSAYLIVSKPRVGWFFVGGILLSIALMTKIVAIFDIAAFVTILFLQFRLRSKSFFSTGKKLLKSHTTHALFAGIVIFPISIGIFYLFTDSMADLLSSTFTNNVGYVGYHNHLIFPLGLVVLKLLFLCVSLVCIYIFREKLTKQEIIIFPWMVFTLFSMFFSDRPYTHYVLMGIIPFCLMIGSMMEKLRVVPLLMTIVICTVVYTYFPIYKKTTAYYQNYKEYIFGDKTFYQYVGFFDRNAVRDYEVAANIQQMLSPEDTIYYWSDSAQLYLLTGVKPISKYIVAYHAIMYEDAMSTTIQQVSDASPQFIVLSKNNAIPQELLQGYTLKYSVERTKIYEKNN
ncbi:MAG TPA: glycosyltransferase family 39 protein [Candidatus Levybacteria bacterium]|nr:glycosyltransferase family 39 protein [Candidatus Levybacteria bacterium]